MTIRDGIPCLMFRMANARATGIVEADARVVFARSEDTLEGENVRRFYDLELSRTRNSVFALTWTVIHWITETSPLFGATPASLAASEIEIIVSVVGLDETLSQTVHARHSFIPEEIAWGARFVDVISRLPDGRRQVDLTHFHEVVDDPVDPAAVVDRRRNRRVDGRDATRPRRRLLRAHASRSTCR